MNRIRLLPEQVANQIAAGEVVERPASVVKELVENALDAGSSRITVEIGSGGRSLIRVVDDGFGMSKDDALLCLERHATSKIRLAEDLSFIATMGFRGEAIPSIASVSRFVLTTRERGEPSGEGCRIIINGGKITEVIAAASPPGTTVEVRQLFFNLPARRKFLRAEETERAHIQQYLVLAALAWPQVGFTFFTDGRIGWQLPPVAWTSSTERSAALRERLRQLHGGDTPLLEVEFAANIEESPELTNDENSLLLRDCGRLASFRVWGFVGVPGVSRGNRNEQHVFVNQRPVENRGLNMALIEGYHTALMRGRYPVCCLFIEIDPAAVDVNVHPQKREVRFREEAAVRRLTGRAIRETLLRFHSNSSPPPASPETSEFLIPELQPSLTSLEVVPELFLGLNPSVLTPSAPSQNLPTESFAVLDPQKFTALLHPSPSRERLPPEHSRSTLSTENASIVNRPDQSSNQAVPAFVGATGAGIPLLRVPLRIVGVIGRLYLILESDRGLVLMDQHAAHERVLFEQMLQRLESGTHCPSQRLLLPETVELSAKDAEFIRRNRETLARLGIGLSEFGDRTFLLDALPPFIRGGNPKQFTLRLIDDLQASGSGVNSLRIGEDVIAKTVCRHAVKANDPLSGPELENLVNDLRRCSMPYTCPHGRPTLIEMNWRDLEKRFGRTG
ncbi:MAG: DNA mismatch repair endonuclease MutL [Pedosphaera sp.]|nr:DNA mismatch repair endonuclease MutL [Pedosphaera sp.]